MPIIEAHILEGYGDEDKSRLTSALTDAVRLVVPAPDEAITVMLHEYPPSNYARGGQRRQPAPARPDPTKIVVAYLTAMEARDLAQAETYTGDGFTMRFPGAALFKSHQELIGWAAKRYRQVKKTYAALETMQNGERTIVYARGTLSGEWLDGNPFAGIRFIDRFELVQDKIVGMEVWNDIAEMRGS